MRKLIIILTSIICMSLFLSLNNVYAEENTKDYTFYFVYEGDAINTSACKMDTGTYFTWTLQDLNTEWTPVFNTSDGYVYIWNGNDFSLTVNMARGTKISNKAYGQYKENPQDVNIFIGGYDNLNILRTAHVTTSGRFWSYSSGFGSTYAQGLKVVGLPQVNMATMTTEEINTIVSQYEYNQGMLYPEPQLIKVVDESYSGTLEWGFNNPLNDMLVFEFTNKSDITSFSIKNLKVECVNIQSNKTIIHELSTRLDYGDPLPDYIQYKRSVTSNLVCINYFMAMFEDYSSIDNIYQVSEVEYDICNTYGTTDSDFIHITYNALTGEVNATSVNVPQLNLPAPMGNGYITSPDTTVTGTELGNILSDWVNNLGLSLQSFSNALISIANCGISVSKAIGIIFENVYGTTIANMVGMGIVCAVLLRILGR